MGFENIILTGFMGTGKTTVGKLLASKLNYEFVDTDDLIMSRCGKTIAQIFETEGENAFRNMEKGVAAELSEKEKLVVSTGGKMMLDTANAFALKKSGKIFCLVATPEEIMGRVSADSAIERPLLQGPAPEERIMRLFEERKEGYGRFTQIDTTGKNPQTVCSEIMDLFQEG